MPRHGCQRAPREQETGNVRRTYENKGEAEAYVPTPGHGDGAPAKMFSVGKCGSCGTEPNASRSCSVIHQNSRERKEQNEKELAEHSHRPNAGVLFALTVPRSPGSAVTNHRTLGRGRGAKTTTHSLTGPEGHESAIKVLGHLFLLEALSAPSSPCLRS